VNFYKEKSYQRQHLRAPYVQEVVFKDEGYVFKAQAANISVGGLMLNGVSHFPDNSSSLDFMLKIPSFPYFKSFDYQKLISYSDDLLRSKVIKMKCEMVRKQSIKSHLDGVLASNVGLRILEISALDKEIINDYVNIFSSNLIYLQTLIDGINNRPDKEKNIRELAEILGYDRSLKIALLNKQVIQDYRSLQWL